MGAYGMISSQGNLNRTHRFATYAEAKRFAALCNSINPGNGWRATYVGRATLGTQAK